MGPYYFFGGSGPTFFCSVNQPEMAQAGSQNIFVVKKEVKTVVRGPLLRFAWIRDMTISYQG